MMLRFAVRGLTPLLMHNGQLADPMNEWTRALAAVTGKRRKTDKDRTEIGRVEFMGGLYVDDSGVPCIPGENIEAMLQAEAARHKMKKQVQSGVISDGLFQLKYNGPRKTDALWEQREQFAFRRGVRNQGRTVVQRTRPIFRDWSLVFDVEVIEEEMNPEAVKDFVPAAGRHTGLGDWRPKFGRFVVEKVEELRP